MRNNFKRRCDGQVTFLMSIFKYISGGALLILFSLTGVAQNVEVSIKPDTRNSLTHMDSSAKLEVRTIIIQGNKRTKDTSSCGKCNSSRRLYHHFRHQPCISAGAPAGVQYQLVP
jgi:hypothetical protein